MVWKAEPYIPANNPIAYVSGQIAAGPSPVSRGSFVATLTNFTRSDDNNIHVADMKSELSVMTSGVDNETVITCQTYVGNKPMQRSTTFYDAGEIS